MTTVKSIFPKIHRPGEYVAFFNMEVSTREGRAYIFLACDAYSEFGFNICLEPDESPASVIKAVYLLTENKDFVKHMHKGFTLVFDRFEELSEQIETVIRPVNGKVLFHNKFHQKIAAPLASTMNQFLRRGPNG